MAHDGTRHAQLAKAQRWLIRDHVCEPASAPVGAAQDSELGSTNVSWAPGSLRPLTLLTRKGRGSRPILATEGKCGFRLLLLLLLPLLLLLLLLLLQLLLLPVLPLLPLWLILLLQLLLLLLLSPLLRTVLIISTNQSQSHNHSAK